jgi:hypothetical protein
VAIFESEFPIPAAGRKLGIELDLDLAAPLFHFLDCGKSRGHQMGRERMAID